MFSLENDSDVVVCPYNKAHRLLRKRLQSHLIKCRKNYPQLELQKCPFNVTHHIPEPEFALHVTNCPDRKLITQYKYDTVETKEEERVKHAPVECDENWDDTEVDDYNPQKFIDTKNVLRKPVGVPPAERKKFIKSERKRLGDDESYSDSDEYDEDELENLVLQAIKNEKENLANSNKEKQEMATKEKQERATKEMLQKSKSPTPTTTKKIRKDATANQKVVKAKSRTRSRSPKTRRRRSRSKSTTRSRSPVSSAYYRRIHGRYSHSPQPPPAPRYREPTFIRERSPPMNNRYRDASPDDYNIDDDPYYSGGSSSSSLQHANYSAGSRKRTPRINHQSAYIAPPLVAYPTRLPMYGRGPHRVYGYDRASGSRSSDLL